MTLLRTLVSLATLLLTTAACGVSDGGSASSADCDSQIKVDDVVFTSYGFSKHVASQHGTALEADCEDVGEDPRGSVFTDRSRIVATYTFAGYPPSQVLGVSYGDHATDGFGVYVTDSVSGAERDRIYEELASPGGTSRGTP